MAARRKSGQTDEDTAGDGAEAAPAEAIVTARMPVTAEATPSMAQFLEIKTANPDSLLWYRMGDFYELFFEDAVVASAAPVRHPVPYGGGNRSRQSQFHMQLADP